MEIIEQIKKVANTIYLDEDGDEFRVRLKKGLSKEDIDNLRLKSPGNRLSMELEDLLVFSKGIIIDKGLLDDVCFDDIEKFGFQELIQDCLNLSGDGAGNFWVQEISEKGEWGKIYFICHDPGIIIKQANSIGEFIHQIHEFLLDQDGSFLEQVYGEITSRIYDGKGRLLEYEEAVASEDEILSDFAKGYNEEWFIADLREAENGEGFRLEGSYKETIRLDNELIWAMKKYKGFWTRLKEWLFK